MGASVRVIGCAGVLVRGCGSRMVFLRASTTRLRYCNNGWACRNAGTDGGLLVGLYMGCLKCGGDVCFTCAGLDVDPTDHSLVEVTHTSWQWDISATDELLDTFRESDVSSDGGSECDGGEGEVVGMDAEEGVCGVELGDGSPPVPGGALRFRGSVEALLFPT